MLGPLPKTASDVLAVGRRRLSRAAARGSLCVSPSCRPSQGPWSPSTRATARSSRSSAASTSTRASTTARYRRSASPGRRSSRSCIPPRSRRASRPRRWSTTRRSCWRAVAASTATRSGGRRTSPSVSTDRRRCAKGLVRSRNLVSIRLLRGTGLGFATRHIGDFGFGPDALPREPHAGARHRPGHAARDGARLRRVRERWLPRHALFHRSGRSMQPAAKYSRRPRRSRARNARAPMSPRRRTSVRHLRSPVSMRRPARPRIPCRPIAAPRRRSALRTPTS